MNRRTFLAALGTSALAAADKPAAEEMAHDPLRPQYHFLPPANWMNDPNGPIFYKGNYHLFYQYNPHGAFWGTMHWGHAISKDMVHWKHLPIAIAPTPGGPDFDGVFSGSAVVYNGVPTMIYTGVKPETQCIATSTDGLMTWKKEPKPVIAGPPEGMKVTGFRDPAPWKEGDTWYVAIGSGFPKKGGAALLYESKDLRNWKYLHPLAEGPMKAGAVADDPVDTGEMWECPDFFPLGKKHVLLYSTMRKVYYQVGEYKNLRFESELQGEVDFGAYYAPKSFAAANGSRVLWGWLPEKRSKEAQLAAGWSGAMSLPRVLTLNSENRLVQSPWAAVEKLRGKMMTANAGPIKDGLLPGVSGDSIELIAEIEPGDAQEVSLTLRAGADGNSPVAITYRPATQEIQFGDVKGTLQSKLDGALQLGLYLDGSVGELYANHGSACLTHRLYPQQTDALGVGLFARGGQARLRSLQAWTIKPVSPDRLTT